MNATERVSEQDRVEDLTSEVAETIRQKFLPGVRSVHEDLLKSGFLDSLSLIQLLADLEEHFAVTIPLAELNIEDLRSVASLARLVADRKAGHVPVEHGS